MGVPTTLNDVQNMRKSFVLTRMSKQSRQEFNEGSHTYKANDFSSEGGPR